MTSRPSSRLLHRPARIQPFLLIGDFDDSEYLYFIHAIFVLNLRLIRWLRAHAS